MKILIIEDNTTLATLIAYHYKNHNVVIVEKLQEAKARLKKDKFDLILVDLHLSDSSGINTLKALNYIPTPKIVMTGGPDVAKEACRNGAMDYIEKSASTGDLLVRIDFNIERILNPKKKNIDPSLFEEIKAYICHKNLTIA